MRTSITHPLAIAEINAGPRMGKVGLNFCPGKKQKNAATGAWDRDLGLDLDAVAKWGAAIVITLVEQHEMERLGVANLRAEVEARHMEWHHYPVPDGTAPMVDGLWSVVGEDCRAVLRDGFNVLVHCKGGLGRAGTVAAVLLSELGMDCERAVELVREARPGAIENQAQELWAMRSGAVGEDLPDSSYEAMEERAVGALLGLAMGDALGTTLEFSARDSKQRITKIVGGGPFKLKPGQWTDDTAMALALADSLLANPKLDEADLMRRFVSWHETGEYSCTGSCFDIGSTISASLRRFKMSGNPFAGSSHPMSAGNGSLMRLAPVAIRHWNDRAILRDVAARQSRTTHGAPEAVDACIAFADVLADVIEGYPRSQVMRTRDYPYAGKIGPIMAGCWRGKSRDQIGSSGYVADSLEAAMWCVGRSAYFADAVSLAANLGGDADTTAAITGQLDGAFYWAGTIAREWKQQLAWGEKIEAKARALFAASLQAPG